MPRTYCASCSHGINTYTMTRDGSVCRACLDEYYVACVECDETIHRNQTTRNAFGSIVCYGCAGEHEQERLSCSECSEAFSVEELHYERGLYLCEECIPNYRNCRGCNGFYRMRSIYCNECRASENIMNYSAKATDYFHGFFDTPRQLPATREALEHRRKQIQKTRFYGIELEVYVNESKSLHDVAGMVRKAVNHFAILKQDSSIPYGFEIVSAPGTLDFHKGDKQNEPAWEKFFQLVDHHPDLFEKVGDGCGIHIHVSKAALSPLQIAKFIKFTYCPENRAFIEAIAERGSNRYNNFLQEKNWGDWRDRTYGNHDARYTAVYVGPPHTIEIRLFRSDLDRGAFYKNLEYTAALLDFCAVASVRDVMDYKKFINFVEFKNKQYPYLYTFIRKHELKALEALTTTTEKGSI